jgi:sirohydrochlorin cobaltochelatase
MRADTIVVLAVHGAPARDFPRSELAELFGLHARLESGVETSPAALEQRHAALDARLRAWPRTKSNDPFWAASLELASHLARATGLEVVLGFNEFCEPDLDEALDEAARRQPARVVVMTPMMTSGGEHAEHDIPRAIERARARHPTVPFEYAWPYDPAEVAVLMAKRLASFGHGRAQSGIS